MIRLNNPDELMRLRTRLIKREPGQLQRVRFETMGQKLELWVVASEFLKGARGGRPEWFVMLLENNTSGHFPLGWVDPEQVEKQLCLAKQLAANVAALLTIISRTANEIPEYLENVPLDNDQPDSLAPGKTVPK